MQGQFADGDVVGLKVGEHFGREMQSGCGRCHRTFGVGIDGLIVGSVALLGFAFQIRRDWDESCSLDDACECDVGVVPGEFYRVGIAFGGVQTRGGKYDRAVGPLGIYLDGEVSVFPTL